MENAIKTANRCAGAAPADGPMWAFQPGRVAFTFQKTMRRRRFDTKRGAQARKELGVTDIDLLVATDKVRRAQPPDQMPRLAHPA